MNKSAEQSTEVKRISERIKAPSKDEVSSEPDAQSRQERQTLSNAKQIAKLKADAHDLAEREKYARYAFFLVAGWLIFIAITVGFQGFHGFGFDLDYKIILALIGGTTTSTIGIFLVVARYIFYRQQRPR